MDGQVFLGSIHVPVVVNRVEPQASLMTVISHYAVAMAPIRLITALEANWELVTMPLFKCERIVGCFQVGFESTAAKLLEFRWEFVNGCEFLSRWSYLTAVIGPNWIAISIMNLEWMGFVVSLSPSLMLLNGKFQSFKRTGWESLICG